MTLHREISFEDDIFDHLTSHGWLGDEGDAKLYDRDRALFPPDVVAWIKESQSKAWASLTKTHGAAAEAVVLDRLRKQLDDRGTLDVLRFGIEMIGLREPLMTAQFKPALMVDEITARYAANRLRVVRQVRYSRHNENSIDIVLFLNGIPVATAELKTDFTQTVADAVDQYRFDRNPKTKGKGEEPLLTFPSGALVHFAVSNSEVRMTTRLAGPDTTFLPFNKGNDGGQGNPPNPEGHPTSYLWETVWERDSWLQILGRYLVAPRDEKRQIKKIIFPRFHQLDASRKLRDAVLADGAGKRYLVQHSAGSGKTNTIAWTAHFLADLHGARNEKLFSSVFVISDRNVIDRQLQEALADFERTKGIVEVIREDQAKGRQIAAALKAGKKIIVCTIQSFPSALAEVRKLAASRGKHFAVLADEAHSSQTGEAAHKLKQVLSSEELGTLEDGGGFDVEDMLAAQVAGRAESDITYIAFTATPKAKTLELFGQAPDPTKPRGPQNLPTPFHVYSMRQAIEEGFILDVLQNYTPYNVAFRLAQKSKEGVETEVDKASATRELMHWVRLHPHNIAQKAEIVVEHFRQNVMPLLGGKAKAMVVLASRKEAVRWQIAVRKYIDRQGYKIGALVAFSGDVDDPQTSPEKLNERSRELNPKLRGRDIREAFKDDEYHLLLVANKFQTGFDEPFLCGMYVDRRLAGIQAVQTLSRLNRSHPGKDTTYVLDFMNSFDDILDAFKAYYTTAQLEDVTDPNIVFDMRAKLDAMGFYDDSEVNRVASVEIDPKATNKSLAAAVLPVADRLLKRFNAARQQESIAVNKADKSTAKKAREEQESLVIFKRDLGSFQRLYGFLSQMFDYGNTEIEKRYLFFRHLIPLLEFGREREEIDITRVVLTHHHVASLGKQTLDVRGGEIKLSPIAAAGTGEVNERERVRLSEIVQRLNDLFGIETTDGDQVSYATAIVGKLLESEELAVQARNNSKARFAVSPTLSQALEDAIMDALDAHSKMSRRALDSEQVREGLKEILLGPAELFELLKARNRSLSTNESYGVDPKVRHG